MPKGETCITTNNNIKFTRKINQKLVIYLNKKQSGDYQLGFRNNHSTTIVKYTGLKIICISAQTFDKVWRQRSMNKFIQMLPMQCT